ncbi:MAG TPA: hypothetical protein VL242_03830 [Sorangium sp.]|nr:hypothetical protein [Sorangium sp.]
MLAPNTPSSAAEQDRVRTLRFDDIVVAPGLREACRILFGDAADDKLAS